MRLSDYISEKQIAVKASSKTKKPALEELLGVLIKLKKISPRSKSKILASLLARERLGSTAIGQSIAIPHARLDLVKRSLVVVGLFKEGLEFDSLDGDPVYIVFLILSPRMSSRWWHMIEKTPLCLQRVRKITGSFALEYDPGKSDTDHKCKPDEYPCEKWHRFT